MAELVSAVRGQWSVSCGQQLSVGTSALQSLAMPWSGSERTALILRGEILETAGKLHFVFRADSAIFCRHGDCARRNGTEAIDLSISNLENCPMASEGFQGRTGLDSTLKADHWPLYSAIFATCTSNPVFGNNDVNSNALNPSPVTSV